MHPTPNDGAEEGPFRWRRVLSCTRYTPIVRYILTLSLLQCNVVLCTDNSTDGHAPGWARAATWARRRRARRGACGRRRATRGRAACGRPGGEQRGQDIYVQRSKHMARKLLAMRCTCACGRPGGGGRGAGGGGGKGQEGSKLKGNIRFEEPASALGSRGRA